MQPGVGAEFEHAAVARRGGNSGEKRGPLVVLFLLASLAPEHLVGADPPTGEAVSPAGERSRVDEPALPPGEFLEVEIQVKLDEAIVFRPPADAPGDDAEHLLRVVNAEGHPATVERRPRAAPVAERAFAFEQRLRMLFSARAVRTAIGRETIKLNRVGKRTRRMKAIPVSPAPKFVF